MSFLRLSAPRGVCALVLAAVVGCGPKDGNREYEQGVEAYAVRDLERADRCFSASLERMPDNVDRLLSLARVKLDLGELKESKELVARAALNANGDADVEMLGAQVAWHLKDYKSARSGFLALADNTKLDVSVRSQALSGLGVVEMSSENYHLARIAFLRAIRLDRRNAAAWYHLGLIYQELGYQESALEQFDIFVRLEQTASMRVQKVQRSVIPTLKDAVAQAAVDRPGASKRNSSVCSSALAKAEKEVKKGSYKTARQVYQDALTADPLSYPAALGLARAWEKSDTSKEGLSKALEAYRTACSLRPSAVTTFLAAGALASRLGLHTQAVEIYSRAIAASPTSLEALDGMIRSLRKVGNKNQIAQAYQLYRDSVSPKKK